MRPSDIVLSVMLASTPLILGAQQGMYTGKAGTVAFKSNAPLEFIQAESHQLSGAINPETNGVAFSVRINSFHGFNSAVQREHFMENYMEATKYPVATFTGKIIETISFTEEGQYDIRVKGILNIHGVNSERLMPGRLIVSKDSTEIHTLFSVPLKDHDINIPKLLSQKIAETIDVEIEMVLQKAN